MSKHRRDPRHRPNVDEQLKIWRRDVRTGTTVYLDGTKYTVKKRQWGGVLLLFRSGFMANQETKAHVKEVYPDTQTMQKWLGG